MDHSEGQVSIMEPLKIQRIYIDYEKSSFMVYIKDHKPVDLLFLEVEGYIEEYDKKLFDYLSKINGLANKIDEAEDIGYNFSPMVISLLESFIEMGLIKIIKL